MKSELIENRIIVWDIEDSRKLFSQGYYGKPIGIPKPVIEEIDAPLILDLIEGLYLLENKKISITKLKQKINVEQMTEICKKEVHEFEKNTLFTKIFEIKDTLSIQELNLGVILQYTKKDQVLIMHHF